MASFSHPKTFQNRFEMRYRFRCSLGAVLALIFGRFWEAKWRFLGCKSCRILRRSSTCRKCINSINSQAKMPSALFGFIHFRTNFRWKSDVKRAPRKTRTWTSIFGGCWWVLGAMLGAKRPFKSCKNDVKKWTKFWRFLNALQDAPGGRFRHPKPPQFYNPRRSLFELVSDTPLGGVQEASETRFWMVFGRFWHRFWMFFGIIFGSFWFHV